MGTATEIKTEAQAYADSIAAGLTAWEVAAYWQVFAGRDEGGEDITLSAYGAEYCPGFKNLEHASEIAEQHLESVNCIAEAWDVYLSDVLEVELMGTNVGDGWKTNTSGWTVIGASVWLTLGGPNCFIEWTAGCALLSVRCQWGSDRGYTAVNCEGLADALERYAEGVGQ